MNVHHVKSYERKANPDDPPVQRPPQGPNGPRPGPNFLGLEGRIAIVQAQVLLLAIILAVQLWIITDALYELLSGQTANLGWLALASGIGFIIALLVVFWPRACRWRDLASRYRCRALSRPHGWPDGAREVSSSARGRNHAYRLARYPG